MPGIAETTRITLLDKRERFAVGGLLCKPVVRGEQNGGSYTIFELTAGPAQGAPMQICRLEDKTLYVVEGEFFFRAGAEMVIAGPGTSVRVPRGTPHGFTNISVSPGRMVVTVSPADHERFLAELSELPQPPGPVAFRELLARYGVELLPERS